jgi:deferrochelatase/peroxidase EfeB
VPAPIARLAATIADRMTLDRRQFLVRSGVLGTSAVGAGLMRAADAHAATAARGDPLAADEPLWPRSLADPAAHLPAVPFHGTHQAGILTAPPPAACFAAFDVMASGRADLAELLRNLTGAARFLATGGAPPTAGDDAAPADSGTLGPVVPADGLTVTVGVGTSMFDHRYGLAARKPAGLFPMRAFPNDHLDPAQCGGDLMLSICAGSADTTLHALRQIKRQTSGQMRIRWRVDGFKAPPRPAGVPRNHLGFKDGIANPDVADPAVARRLVWLTAGRGDQAWTVGGTYHVCRVIRILTESWDDLSLRVQQRIVGRRRDSGAPLGGHAETQAPDYRSDPGGRVIPLNAHIRLANPRTARTEDSRILRRGYNYDRGIDGRGDLDMGLVFNCFQRNIRGQFEAVQKRLVNEPMAPFVSPVGGGYFFSLPGVRDDSDWFGRGLLAS